METEKISLKKCKIILQSDESVYTDEEVYQIRDFLYKIANLEQEVFLKTQKKKLETDKNAL